MRVELNNQESMQRKISYQKIKINPWIGVIAALLLIIPSLYIILDNITTLRIEHIILTAGIILLIKSLKSIFDKILDISDEME